MIRSVGSVCVLLIAATASPQTLNLDDPEDALKAYRKIQSSLEDGEPTLYWWEGRAYSRVPGEKDRLLFAVEGMNVRASKTFNHPDRGYGFRSVSREILLYLDPDSKEILRTWTNPWTNKEVEVVHVANDPVNMRQPIYANGAQGPFRFRGTFKDGTVWTSGEVPLFYDNPLGGDYQDYVGGTYHAMEMLNFFLREDDLLDGSKHFVEDATLSWSRISNWLPWMEMGSRPGIMVFHTAGKRLGSWDQLPRALRDEIDNNYPEYREPPPLDDERPNVTSWIHFKKVLDAKSPR